MCIKVGWWNNSINPVIIHFIKNAIDFDKVSAEFVGYKICSEKNYLTDKQNACSYRHSKYDFEQENISQ